MSKCTLYTIIVLLSLSLMGSVFLLDQYDKMNTDLLHCVDALLQALMFRR